MRVGWPNKKLGNLLSGTCLYQNKNATTNEIIIDIIINKIGISGMAPVAPIIRITYPRNQPSTGIMAKFAINITSLRNLYFFTNIASARKPSACADISDSITVNVVTLVALYHK